MAAVRLAWETIKALPKAAFYQFLYKLGKERGSDKEGDSLLKDGLDAAKETYPVQIYDKIKNAYDAGTGNKKAKGGMMNARKKNMGLKMAKGGPVGSGLKPVPSGNKGLSQLPTPVRNKMGFMKKGGMVKKRAKSSSKKSRGMGAAKRGGSFKGTF
jgi:hypothetical protein